MSESDIVTVVGENGKSLKIDMCTTLTVRVTQLDPNQVEGLVVRFWLHITDY